MWRILRTYHRFLWRYRLFLLLFWVCLFIASLLETIEPYFYKLFVDTISDHNLVFLSQLLFIYVFIRFGELIFQSLMRWLGDAVLLPASRDARLSVFRHIQDLDFAYHASKSSGSLISCIKRGDGAFFDFFHSIYIDLTRITVSFLIMSFFLIRLDLEFSLIIFSSLIVVAVIASYVVKYNIHVRKEFNRVEDEVSDIIVDNLINFDTVKLFAKEEWEFSRLQHSFVRWLKSLWDYSASFRILELSVGTVGNIGILLTMLLGARYLQEGRLSLGEYLMVFGFLNSFYPRFFEMVYTIRNIAKHSVDIQRYFSVLDQPIIIKDPVHPKHLTQVRGNIEFKEVSFAYPSNKNKAVHHINLHLHSGQSVALVGHSGVGKTTLVKLLMRFYDPDHGQITLDGIDIRRVTKNELRSHMGIVPQEPIMFNNSVAYNIAYGSSDADTSQVVAAAKLANLHEFIMSLPNTYDTNVGERGVKLSGGQKQRLAIARMILANPDIVIFDEATSQLDSESEKLIQDAFWKAVKDKTTIIIAHRLSTVTRAEKIIVMEHGRVAESGSHRQLLSQPDSLYSRFWRLQTEG